MMNSDPEPTVEPVAPANPRAPGAVLLALIAALLVSGIWFAFYMVVFLPRAVP